MKKCTKCNETKLLSDFGLDKKNHDGHRGKCKKCFNIYKKIAYHDLIRGRKKHYDNT